MQSVLQRWTTLLSLSAVFGGCDSQSATRPADPEVALDFALVSPMIGSDDLIARAFNTLPTPPPDPDEPAASDVGGEFSVRPQQQIWGASSRGRFVGNEARFLATHDYIGNVGYIGSRVDVTENDRAVTSVDSESQDYTPFLVDFGQVKTIYHPTTVHIEEPCGVTVTGRSQHKASWEFFQGRSAPNWGVAIAPSYAKPFRGPCDRPTGERRGTLEEEGGRVCTVLITYDLATSEIVNVQILSCYNVGDDRW